MFIVFASSLANDESVTFIDVSTKLRFVERKKKKKKKRTNKKRKDEEESGKREEEKENKKWKKGRRRVFIALLKTFCEQTRSELEKTRFSTKRRKQKEGETFSRTINAEADDAHKDIGSI